MQTRLALMFISVMTVFLCSLSAAGQQSIEDKKITIHFERAAFGKVIEVLVEKYDMAFSFEQSLSLSSKDTFFDFRLEQNIRYVPVRKDGSLEVWPEQPDEAKKYRFSVNFDEAKLSEVMDTIVAQMPDYKWEINDGIVNLLPAKNRNELFQQLLAIKIKKFDVDEPYIVNIENEMMKIPELTKFVKDNNLCTDNLNGLNPVFNLRKLPDEIHYTDLTLEELLNRITKIKRGGWLLRKTHYSNSNECINIQI